AAAVQTAAVPEPERAAAVQTAAVPEPERAVAGGEEGAAGTEPPVPGADGYQRRLRRTVAVEAAISAVVLAVTTLLTGTEPGRAEGERALATAAAQAPQAKVLTIPFDMGTAGRQGTVQITLAPGRVGANTVEAVVYSADGGFATVPELRLTLTQEALDIGPIDARLKNQRGHWAAYDLRLPLPGEWTAKVTVRTTEIDQTTVSHTLRITPPSP
ncbi:copper-binding protein, partial [Streptomyces sp. NPDC059851]